MAKMTRAEKRRRKIAKIVEMKLDGVLEPVVGWMGCSFEELHRRHSAWKRNTRPDYYGASMVDVLNQKAREMQRSMDRAILEELNVKPINTD